MRRRDLPDAPVRNRQGMDWLTDSKRKDGTMYRRYIKRILDVVASLVLLPFFLGLCLFLVPAIRLGDGGPAFYVAKRLGRKQKAFRMYKFRSMVRNAPDIRLTDGSTYNAPDDPRLTRIGRFLRKTSLDETPQLINVLLGHMSIIGPRPDLPEQVELYAAEEFEKLSVRPGITGLSQAYYRNSVEWKKRLSLDVTYARSLSFMLDVKILMRTVATVLKRSNVYAKDPGAFGEAHPKDTGA